jgi:hypothetical protein
MLGRAARACYGSSYEDRSEHRANDAMEKPVDETVQMQSETPSGPRLGLGRPTFGMTRDQGKRLEVTFVMKSGGTITVVEELDEPVSAEVLADYAKQLGKDLAEARPRSFVDNWNTSGQHAWVNLGEVVAFSLRPSK